MGTILTTLHRLYVLRKLWTPDKSKRNYAVIACGWVPFQCAEFRDPYCRFTLFDKEISEIFGETAPEFIEHNQGLFLRAHLQSLIVMEPIKSFFVLEIATNLPNVISSA